MTQELGLCGASLFTVPATILRGRLSVMMMMMMMMMNCGTCPPKDQKHV
jgi:hypothetical protein